MSSSVEQVSLDSGTSRLDPSQVELTLRTRYASSKTVLGMDISASGEFVAVACDYGATLITQPSRTEDGLAVNVRMESSVHGVCFVPHLDTDVVAWALGRERMVKFCDPRTGEEVLPPLSGVHTGLSWGVGFSANGALVFTTGDDHRLVVWDFESKSKLFEVRLEPKTLRCLQMSPTDQCVAVAASGGEVFLFHAREPLSSREGEASVRELGEGAFDVVGPLDAGSQVQGLAFDDAGQWLAVAHASDSISIIDVAAGTITHRFVYKGVSFRSCRFVPGSSLLFVGTTAGTLAVVDVARSELVVRYDQVQASESSSMSIKSIRFLPDHRHMVLSGASATLIFELPSELQGGTAAFTAFLHAVSTPGSLVHKHYVSNTLFDRNTVRVIGAYLSSAVKWATDED